MIDSGVESRSENTKRAAGARFARTLAIPMGLITQREGTWFRAHASSHVRRSDRWRAGCKGCR
jgi:hypothetical protein